MMQVPFLPAIFQKKKDVLYAKVPIKVPFHLPTSWHFRGSLAFVMVIVWEKMLRKIPLSPSPLSSSIISNRSNIARFVDDLCEKIGLILLGFIQRKGFKFFAKIAARLTLLIFKDMELGVMLGIFQLLFDYIQLSLF